MGSWWLAELHQEEGKREFKLAMFKCLIVEEMCNLGW